MVLTIRQVTTMLKSLRTSPMMLMADLSLFVLSFTTLVIFINLSTWQLKLIQPTQLVTKVVTRNIFQAFAVRQTSTQFGTQLLITIAVTQSYLYLMLTGSGMKLRQQTSMPNTQLIKVNHTMVNSVSGPKKVMILQLNMFTQMSL